jgi:dienelactone hydrolase
MTTVEEIMDPKGIEIKMNEISVYHSKPKESKKAIICLHDILGWKFKNTRILVDKLANETGNHVSCLIFFKARLSTVDNMSFWMK